MARPFSSRTTTTVVIAATAVLVTVVVATVASGGVLGRPRSEGPPTRPDLSGHRIHRARLNVPQIPEWLTDTLLVLLALGVIAVVVFTKKAVHERRTRLQYEEEEPGSGDWDASLVVELAAAAAEQTRRILEGEPRNAIVACWLRFQQATGRAGLPALPAETSTEFTLRVLRRLRLDDVAITTLSELYREARFSAHVMGEPQRAAAAAALDVLADQLNPAPSSPANVGVDPMTVGRVSP